MLVNATAAFLGISILFYCLFAGADFGAGILEIFIHGKKQTQQRELISHAMGPVWEANHVWLILAVVIGFNGFPRAYSAASIAFHIPLTLVLCGIILRGCAFTFRHYDVAPAPSHVWYSAIFHVSSLMTPLFLGMVAGASLLGKVTFSGADFYSQYVDPWANLFCLSVGLFTCALFAFLASVYLIGETKDPELRVLLVHRARIFNAISLVLGALVFAAAEIDGLPLIERFVSEPLSLMSMVGATLLFIPIWIGIEKEKAMVSRMIAASQVALILIGWFDLQFPVILAFQDPTQSLTVHNAAATSPVLRILLCALCVGCGLIFPALIYLLRIFKSENRIKDTDRSSFS